jgi:lipopolysaccharide/colanic/teichoic acid biosynthesis glycosyltransferase
MYANYFKKFLDCFFALLLIIIAFPLLLILGTIAWGEFKKNPFFIQTRTGYKGKHFNILKFRTMTDTRDKDGVLLHDDMRITRLGKFFRRWNLDELPQLFNILRGEMSFIGPRPLPIRYEPLYSKEQFRRHMVRPGITGLAQVNGRRSVSWKTRLSFDLQYLSEVSFRLDSVIFFRSFRVFADRSISEFGISQSPETYLPNFEE